MFQVFDDNYYEHFQFENFQDDNNDADDGVYRNPGCLDHQELVALRSRTLITVFNLFEFLYIGG